MLSIVARKIADAFGNRYYISLNFEILTSNMSFYQIALGDWLKYEPILNNYHPGDPYH